MRLRTASLKTLALLLVISCCVMSWSTPARALDKRLKLMFKTAGYGAAAGFVLGAGTTALGLGGFRNILMGTSAGLYAGIALAAYIVATPPESPSSRLRRGQNPYAPRRPVQPDDDYDEDQDEIQQMVPDSDKDENQPESSVRSNAEWMLAAESATGRLRARGEGVGARPERREIAIWTPLVSLQF